MVLVELFLDPAAWISLITLVILECVLGIDNLLVISLTTNRLPEARRALARRMGLAGALVLRLLLLAGIAWIIKLDQPFLTVLDHGVSVKDLILIAGGAFLVYKSVGEIHDQIEGDHGAGDTRAAVGFWGVIANILALDMVFSLDSIITAVGVGHSLPIMIVAVIIAVLMMMVAAGPLADFVNRHPTVVMLCLAMLSLIGVSLIAEGIGFHLEKGYIYAAVGFSLLIESLNILRRRKGRRHLPTGGEPPPAATE